MEQDDKSCDLITEVEAAEFLRLSVGTLRNWRSTHHGPPFYKLAGLRGPVRYKRSDLAAWVGGNVRLAAPAGSVRRNPLHDLCRELADRVAPRRKLIPDRVVEELCHELATCQAGTPNLTEMACDRLSTALLPFEARLIECLATTERRPDGTFRLSVPRAATFTDAHLPADQWMVRVDYDPRTGRWVSDVAAGGPGFARLAAHVWRIEGGSGRMAEVSLLALVGLAFLGAQPEARD